jgi:hypothetical protein
MLAALPPMLPGEYVIGLGCSEGGQDLDRLDAGGLPEAARIEILLDLQHSAADVGTLGGACVLREDATQSMPPNELWLQGRDQIGAWLLGPGAGCRGSRLVATVANGSPAFGQYRQDGSGDGHEAWALQVVDISRGQIVALTAFLDAARLFPLFGLPLRLEA